MWWKEVWWLSFTQYEKRSFRDALNNGKLTGRSVLNAKVINLNKINVSFFLNVFVNNASVSKLFEHTSYLQECAHVCVCVWKRKREISLWIFVLLVWMELVIFDQPLFWYATLHVQSPDCCLMNCSCHEVVV